jgi:uncharacterized repeat protein (TIGR03803 family)
MGGSDEGDPSAPLDEGTDGNFYGTTTGGVGTVGTVYKITPSGKLTTLYQFDDTHGSTPWHRWFRAPTRISMERRRLAAPTEA